MAMTVLHRVTSVTSSCPQTPIDQPRRQSVLSRGASDIARNLGTLFRRLALITFLETFIATYLVYQKESTNLATTHLGTVLVVLVGFFLTIVLAAASVAFTDS